MFSLSAFIIVCGAIKVITGSFIRAFLGAMLDMSLIPGN
jgi:hypothetical protein